MKTRRLWMSMVLLAGFTFVLQLSHLAKAQNASDQNQGAQNQDAQADDDPAQDPPGRVARLNDAEGSISFRPAGEDDWVAGVPNRPMVAGDDLWADEDSRAEVHVGSAAIRLGAKTGITFLALDDHTTQIRLAQGELIVNARHVDDDDNYEIDTPNVALTFLQPGEYRIDVSEDGSQTIVDVFHGRGRVTGGGYTYTVVAGQSASFSGSDQVAYDLQQLPGQDDFDAWAFDRDQQENDADSANYVSREMTGYEDLDQYGDWTYIADYGPCWRPRVLTAGWAPYRFGHWIWVGRWGWTWVEDERWGFAPFHYGRWANVNNGWFWVPGPAVVRPIWAPALVAFVGGGAHFSAGVGWFPLAPGEVYIPGYRVSRAYVNNVNITNTTVDRTRITNVYNAVVVNKTVVSNTSYVNAHSNAVTVVSHESFVNARPVAQNIVKVDAHEIAAAPVSHVAAAEPVRNSVMGVGHPAAANARPPAAVISRTVVAVRTPPPPPRPMDQRQASAGGHLNQQSVIQKSLVRPSGAAQPAPMNQAATTPSPAGADGFRSFAAPSSAAPNGNNPQVKQMPQAQPRVYEQQGRSGVEDDHNGQVWNPNPETGQREFHPPQTQQQSSSAPQQTHPLVRPAPAVQERNEQHEQQQEQKFNSWQQQRPSAPAPAARPSSPPPAPRSAPAPAPRQAPAPAAAPSKKG
jgi:hypothetical protein